MITGGLMLSNVRQYKTKHNGWPDFALGFQMIRDQVRRKGRENKVTRVTCARSRK